MSRKPFAGAAVVACLGAGAIAPQAADAALPKSLRSEYLKAYAKVTKQGGKPGRNIVRDGVAVGSKGKTREARTAEVRKSLVVLRNMGGVTTGTGRVRVAGATAQSPRTATVPTAGGGNGGSLPACTWVPESGGDYGARGPGGAGGKYQIIPSTWKAYGGSGGNAADASPAEQEAVASRVMAGQGPSAWVNC